MKITLYRRKLKTGKISLSIEYYRGSEINAEGKRRHLRTYENLGLYLYEEPKNRYELSENKENEQKAEAILAIRKAEYLQGKFDIKNLTKTKRTFLNFFNDLVEEKQNNSSNNNYGNWYSTQVHLKKIISPNLTFDDIDDDFIKRVKQYFDKEAKTKSNLLLSPNSKYSYFNKFKASLRRAFEEGYLSINYAQRVKSFQQSESNREHLTIEEIRKLTNTECKYEVLKRAFLFSCLTGLRWSDINALVWSEIREEGDGCKINFRQKKTKGVEYQYITDEARELLGQRQGLDDKVFIGLKYGAIYNYELSKWMMRAGIYKSITFHCARHTYAVLLLENGVDIYTVSKLLGHREIRTTAVYARIVDNKIKEAVNKIPKINL